MILFDLNGTLTDPGAIGGAWGAPDLGVAVLAAAVLAAAVQSAMVDALLGELAGVQRARRGGAPRRGGPPRTRAGANR